jgi:predicted RNA-binding protein with PIN domain
MIVIIDAYNVLKQTSRSTNVTPAERTAFITLLKQYSAIKKIELLLVFDGGDFSWPTQEDYKRVTVIYPGLYNSADNYIEEYIVESQTKDLLLISSDHQLSLYAQSHGIASMHSLDFYHRVRQTISQKQADRQQATLSANMPLIKTTSNSNNDLARLMEEGSKKMPQKDAQEPENELTNKKLSKQERILLKKAKKL